MGTIYNVDYVCKHDENQTLKKSARDRRREQAPEGPARSTQLQWLVCCISTPPEQEVLCIKQVTGPQISGSTCRGNCAINY